MGVCIQWGVCIHSPTPWMQTPTNTRKAVVGTYLPGMLSCFQSLCKLRSPVQFNLYRMIVLVDGEAETRVNRSALIKMDLDHPIGQFCCTPHRQQVPLMILEPLMSLGRWGKLSKIRQFFVYLFSRISGSSGSGRARGPCSPPRPCENKS